MTFHLKTSLADGQLLTLRQLHEQRTSVWQNTDYRWLCINETVQSVMRLDQPSALVLPHLHGLCIGFFLQPRANQVLELGLGGGALARFLAAHLPDVQLHSVELESTIIDLFANHFAAKLRKHRVLQGDARQAIKAFREQDMLVVDLFAGNQSPAFLSEPDFYQDCFAALHNCGLLILNLLPAHSYQAEQIRLLLLELSGQRPLILSIPGYKNRLFFASRNPIPPLRYSAELVQFAERHGIDLNQFIQL